MSTITLAMEVTPSPTTMASTAAAQRQAPVLWIPVATSWNGILLRTAALKSIDDLANTKSALITLKVSEILDVYDT